MIKDEFYKKLHDYLAKRPYGDHIVRIRLRYDPHEEWKYTTEFLAFDGIDDNGEPRGVWENDWYEGQREVELLGAIPMHYICISGFPEKSIIITEGETA